MMYLGNIRRFANILSAPNNILGIEYLKAIKKQNSMIRPIALKRKESNHNDNLFSPSSSFSSASAIRIYVIRMILHNYNVLCQNLLLIF